MKNLKEIGIGSFRTGREPNGRHNTSIGLHGPTSNADTVISQRMQGHAYPKDEYHEDYNDEEYEEDLVLECRIYRGGKYQLIETLQNLKEYKDYSSEFNSQMKKISNSAKDRKANIDNLPGAEDYLDEDVIDEFSGVVAGGGGPATPLGSTAKGEPETPTQRKKRQRFNMTKSYPYNRKGK